jgi:hypothetical protein
MLGNPKIAVLQSDLETNRSYVTLTGLRPLSFAPRKSETIEEDEACAYSITSVP